MLFEYDPLSMELRSRAWNFHDAKLQYMRNSVLQRYLNESYMRRERTICHDNDLTYYLRPKCGLFISSLS